MASLALYGTLASRNVHSRDDGQVRGHTLGHRADRGRRDGESYGRGRCGRGPAGLVRSFAHLPRSFLEDRREELAI